jgi:hypothetical protein
MSAIRQLAALLNRIRHYRVRTFASPCQSGVDLDNDADLLDVMEFDSSLTWRVHGPQRG